MICVLFVSEFCYFNTCHLDMLVVQMVVASAISRQNCKRQELLLNIVTLFWPAMLLAFKVAPVAPFRPLLCLTVQCTAVCTDNDYFEKKKFNQTCCGI